MKPPSNTSNKNHTTTISSSSIIQILFEDRQKERHARLAYWLSIDAPSDVIAQECRLVLRSHHGSDFRAIYNLTTVLIRDAWTWYFWGFQMWLHDKLGIHFRWSKHDPACWICESEAISCDCDIEK